MLPPYSPGAARHRQCCRGFAMTSSTIPGLPPQPAADSATEIDNRNLRVYYLSRNWACLILALAAFLAAGVLLGRLLEPPATSTAAREPAAVLQKELHERRPNLALASECVLHLDTWPASLDAELAQSHFPPGSRAVLSSLIASLRDGFGEPNARLLILAHQAQPEPGANAALAEFFQKAGNSTGAMDYYRRELAIAPSAEIRGKMIGLLANNGDLSTLEQLSKDPAYATLIPPSLQLRLATVRKDWGRSARLFAAAHLETVRPQALIMTLAAALAWFVIALHAGQPHHWLSFRMLAPLLATAIGAAGGMLAQWLTVAQGEVLGLTPSGAFLADLGIYAGILAPRDTLIQLVLMLPFLPILAARKSALDTLVVTGCVGLGFATAGTLELCKQLSPADSLGRLLTSNFFHFAAAALVGLAVCRCLNRERGSFTAALVSIPAVILTQGVYDAFTRIAGAHVLVVLATIAFLVLSRVFFMELRRHRDSFTDQCFLGATLILSLGALVATVLVAVASEHGLEAAAKALARNLPTLLMVSVVFFGQFKRGFAPIGSDLLNPSRA